MQTDRITGVPFHRDMLSKCYSDAWRLKKAISGIYIVREVVFFDGMLGEGLRTMKVSLKGVAMDFSLPESTRVKMRTAQTDIAGR